MVTPETFAAWKAKKEAERLSALEKQRELKKAAKGGAAGAAGAAGASLSGKDLFSFDPSLFVDVDGAADECDYEEDADWAEEVRRNQEAMDAANATARAASLQESDEEAAAADDQGNSAGDARGESDETTAHKSTAKQKGDADPIKRELFLEDIAPDELDALDD